MLDGTETDFDDELVDVVAAVFAAVVPLGLIVSISVRLPVLVNANISAVPSTLKSMYALPNELLASEPIFVHPLDDFL